MFYIVWKWSIGAPIIAGRRKRGAKELEPEQIEALIEYFGQTGQAVKSGVDCDYETEGFNN